jgi:excisionase family DNA binding protein
MSERNYTTIDIAKLLDVTQKTVARWIDAGKLDAFVTPGGHRRVYASVLAEFLKKYKMHLPPELEALDKTRVLVVDDNANIVKTIVRFLNKEADKYDIYTAADGFQAGQAISDHNPQLVILDIKLPGIDGFKVCESIRKRNKDTKILAITGYDTPDNKKKIIACGANAYLPKPFDMKNLDKAIKRLLS